MIELVSAYSSFQEISLSNVPLTFQSAAELLVTLTRASPWWVSIDCVLMLENYYSHQCLAAPAILDWQFLETAAIQYSYSYPEMEVKKVAASCHTFQTCSEVVEIVVAMEKRRAVASNHWALEALAYQEMAASFLEAFLAVDFLQQ